VPPNVRVISQTNQVCACVCMHAGVRMLGVCVYACMHVHGVCVYVVRVHGVCVCLCVCVCSCVREHGVRVVRVHGMCMCEHAMQRVWTCVNGR